MRSTRQFSINEMLGMTGVSAYPQEAML